ncbi:PilZ domain-containing protein [Rhodopseudomonas sp. B29]|uniref:PilZ domain-containing protein n=1 Tax=Rhodopseudomonas sp. B29 TaxID=95607 RepID=UPI0003B5EB48|nr:PilZ domain-containing protein [Rhodopseudomonas sp. B29]
MIEKRASPRQRVFKRGTIVMAGGGGFDCTVRNLSETGARIDLSDPVELPDRFLLVIESENSMRRCRPVWNTAARIGLAFE